MSAPHARKLKIGYICADVDIPILGHEGCSVKIREFTDALVEAGHDVFILCNWLGEDGAATPKARVYHVQPQGLDALAWQQLEREPAVENNHLERDLKSLCFNHWLKTEGAAILEQEQPDLLYEVYSLFGYAGVELGARYRIPVILEVNAPLCREQAGYSKFPFTRTAEALERAIFRAADVVVAVSDVMRDFIIQSGTPAERVHAVPNGVGEHFCGDISGEAVRRQAGLVGKRVIGFIGSFHWWHDVDTLVQAFARLSPTDPDLRLLLVGHGDKRAEVQEAVRRLHLTDAVVFTGRVPHERIPEYIAAMDVATAPFRVLPNTELYFSPMKLFEYMAVGRASLATDLAQMRQVIRPGENGWLCPPGDAAQMAEGLRRLLYTPGLAASIGAAARREVLSQLTWHAVSDRILRLAGPGLAAKTGAWPAASGTEPLPAAR